MMQGDLPRLLQKHKQAHEPRSAQMEVGSGLAAPETTRRRSAELSSSRQGGAREQPAALVDLLASQQRRFSQSAANHHRQQAALAQLMRTAARPAAKPNVRQKRAAPPPHPDIIDLTEPELPAEAAQPQEICRVRSYVCSAMTRTDFTQSSSTGAGGTAGQAAAHWRSSVSGSPLPPRSASIRPLRQWG